MSMTTHESAMRTLDGGVGEGGGQILRTALALSLATGTPFRLERIRAKRSRPGLLRQHLTALNAATAIGEADVTGAEIGSSTITFAPRGVRAGAYRFAIGSAGSATLVLQTVLPALMLADARSELVLEGGTHNPLAPPFDFLARAFLPLIARMGPRVEVELERPGFYPAGGGRFRVAIDPVSKLTPLTLLDRGETLARRAIAWIANLDPRIGQRELAIVREKLGWPEDALELRSVSDTPGPGNALVVEVASEHVTEVFSGFGERGVRAEAVADGVVTQVRRYLVANAPVGVYLADQLLLPLALSGGGAFRTQALSRHATTNIEVIRQFLDVSIASETDENGRALVRVGPHA
jgi:RNA 3'-terminal phosphate cyclase (ATP)